MYDPLILIDLSLLGICLAVSITTSVLYYKRRKRLTSEDLLLLWLFCILVCVSFLKFNHSLNMIWAAATLFCIIIYGSLAGNILASCTVAHKKRRI